jgi:hypothetical protein
MTAKVWTRTVRGKISEARPRLEAASFLEITRSDLQPATLGRTTFSSPKQILRSKDKFEANCGGGVIIVYQHVLLFARFAAGRRTMANTACLRVYWASFAEYKCSAARK